MTLKQQLEGKRWHQAHEERHLQRCDDKQQPNDQEHQLRSTSSSMIRSTRANYKQQLEGKQQLHKQQLEGEL